MKLGDYKGRKVTKPFFPKNSRSPKKGDLVLKWAGQLDLENVCEKEKFCLLWGGCGFRLRKNFKIFKKKNCLFLRIANWIIYIWKIKNKKFTLYTSSCLTVRIFFQKMHKNTRKQENKKTGKQDKNKLKNLLSSIGVSHFLVQGYDDFGRTLTVCRQIQFYFWVLYHITISCHY